MCYSATVKMSLKAPTVILLVLCVSGVFAADEYVAEIAEECNKKSDFISCGKYELSKLVVKAANASWPSKLRIVDGMMDFVTLDKPETKEALFPSAARQMSGDSQLRKFAKFIQRQVDAFLGSRAISITLPGQTRIVDADDASNEIVASSDGMVEARGKKKKINMIIPMIILLKLFKVKIMMVIVLGAVLIIKKLLILILVLAPSYLNMLKLCKMPHYPHVEEHMEPSTGYGHGGGGGGYSSYGKDWSGRRAYAAYAYQPT